MSDVIIKNYNGNEKTILHAIIDKLWLQRIKAGMPVMVAIVGKSSSGKSVFTEYVQEYLYRNEANQDKAFFVEPSLLIKPSDYAPKMDNILFNNDYKSIFTVQLDEAKFLISSDDWQQFKNKATRTITATSRAIKPLIFFLLAQRRSDIEARTRQALDYYVEIVRKPNQSPYALISEVYEDKKKFNDPEFKTRLILVTVQHKDGVTESFIPRIRFPMPSEEVWAKYKSLELPTKKGEIKHLLEIMKKEESKLSGETDEKLKNYLNYLKNNPAELEKIGKITKRGWKVSKDTVARMGYTSKEIRDLEVLISKSYSDFEQQVVKNE